MWIWRNSSAESSCSFRRNELCCNSPEIEKGQRKRGRATAAAVCVPHREEESMKPKPTDQEESQVLNSKDAKLPPLFFCPHDASFLYHLVTYITIFNCYYQIDDQFKHPPSLSHIKRPSQDLKIPSCTRDYPILLFFLTRESSKEGSFPMASWELVMRIFKVFYLLTTSW